MNHAQLVERLNKPGEQLLAEMDAADMDLIHMTMGICGEAGEILDAVKKAVMYRKTLDLNNVLEELGDIEFYLEGFRQALGIRREDCLEHNINKLSKRYPTLEYSDGAAIARKDKE